MFGEDTSASASNTYESKWNNSISHQSCAANSIIYRTIDDEVDDNEEDETLSDLYWYLKEGIDLKITTGFRVWKSEGDDTPWRSGDAAEVAYALYDFGFEEPEPSVIIPDEDELNQDATEGAAALATAAVTALTAMLMF